MSKQPPLDFGKVEVLRKHMLITVKQLCELFGVTRMTYYGWLKGKGIRAHNDYKVRRVLKKLLTIMNEHQWPTPNAIAMSSKKRYEHLLELIGDND